jgi:hypothetical protein
MADGARGVTRHARGFAHDSHDPAEAMGGTRRVVQVNPAFVDSARPGDIQLLTLFRTVRPARLRARAALCREHLQSL